MDMITLAMLNSLKKSGAVGNETKNRVSVNTRNITGGDLTVMGAGFSFVSPLTPTKEDLAKGHFNIVAYSKETGEVVQEEDLFVKTVMFDSEKIYGGIIGYIRHSYITTNSAIAIVYEAGEFPDLGVIVDRPGIYLHVDSSSGFEGEEMYINIEWETIHPIAPKYIPPLDSLTLNGADGKQYKLSVDESGQLVTAAIE